MTAQESMMAIAQRSFRGQWPNRNTEQVIVFANGHVFDKAERRKAIRQLINMMRREAARDAV